MPTFLKYFLVILLAFLSTGLYGQGRVISATSVYAVEGNPNNLPGLPATVAFDVLTETFYYKNNLNVWIPIKASQISFDPASSGLISINVQDAIIELSGSLLSGSDGLYGRSDTVNVPRIFGLNTVSLVFQGITTGLALRLDDATGSVEIITTSLVQSVSGPIVLSGGTYDINVGAMSVTSDGYSINSGNGLIEFKGSTFGTGSNRLFGMNSDTSLTTVIVGDGLVLSGDSLKVDVASLDPSATNEGSLTVGPGTGTTSVINSNTAGSTPVTIEVLTGLSISESGNTITITNTGDTNASDDLTTSTNFAGDVTGLYNNLQLGTGVVGANELAATTVTLGSYGGATSIPVYTVDADGRLTASSTITIGAISSIDGVSNDAGNVDFIASGIVTITPNDGANTITFGATEVDGSVSNEGTLGVSAGTGTTAVITSNTSGANGVTLSASTGLAISESTSSNGGTITFTNSAPDQTVSITGAGITNVTGTYPNFTVTSTEVDGSTTNEGSLSVVAGGSNDSQIQSNTPGSTNVTLAGGTGITITESGSTITFATSGTVDTTKYYGAWYNETNFTGTSQYITSGSAVFMNNLTFASGRVTNNSGTTRRFKVDYNVEITRFATTLTPNLFIAVWDGATYTRAPGSKTSATLSASNTPYNLSASCIVSLPDGDGINLELVSASTINVNNISVVITEL